MNLLKGKRGLVMGVANDKSLGWAIAKAANQQGAEIAFTYQSDMLLKRIEPLAEEVRSKWIYQCDVAIEGEVERCFQNIEKEIGKFDFIIHSIAFADKNELRGRYLETTLPNFLNSMNISCYSLVSVAKHGEKLLNPGGSITTLTYLGAQKVIPNYNVMGVAKAALECSVKYLANDLGPVGIRVNAISAGPVRTLAAAGISDFRAMQRAGEQASPLRRSTTQEDVAGAGLFLLSELGKGVTGEILYVDCGYNIMGMYTSASEVDAN